MRTLTGRCASLHSNVPDVSRNSCLAVNVPLVATELGAGHVETLAKDFPTVVGVIAAPRRVHACFAILLNPTSHLATQAFSSGFRRACARPRCRRLAGVSVQRALRGRWSRMCQNGASHQCPGFTGGDPAGQSIRGPGGGVSGRRRTVGAPLCDGRIRQRRFIRTHSLTDLAVGLDQRAFLRNGL